MRDMPPRMNIVRKDEKEAKLTQFIERFLAARRASAALAGTAIPSSETCYLVARSAESPVAKVLQHLLPHFATLGLSIKALYAMPGETPPVTPGLLRIEARRAGDVRLLEAHELLILGPATAWVGDCMRREPAHGDAYEFYADDCHEMSAAALRTFDRLWAIAKPFRPRLVAHNPMPQLPPTPAQVLNLDAGFPVSFSRH